METEQALRGLGLNDSEVKIYLELLKLGSSKVNDLAKRLSLPRTTVYNILDSLIAKGLVSHVIKAGVKHFEATEPNRLMLIEQEKLDNLKSIIPELEKAKGIIGKKPFLELYEGKEGIKTILENILRMPSGSVLYSYANNDLFEYLGFYFPHFVTRRVKAGIKAKIIQEKVAHLVKRKEEDEAELRELRFTEAPFKSSVFIWEDKVALITLKQENIIGIMVENKIIAETQML